VSPFLVLLLALLENLLKVSESLVYSRLELASDCLALSYLSQQAFCLGWFTAFYQCPFLLTQVCVSERVSASGLDFEEVLSLFIRFSYFLISALSNLAPFVPLVPSLGAMPFFRFL
jgi:hypothetical protein